MFLDFHKIEQFKISKSKETRTTSLVLLLKIYPLGGQSSFWTNLRLFKFSKDCERTQICQLKFFTNLTRCLEFCLLHIETCFNCFGSSDNKKIKRGSSKIHNLSKSSQHPWGNFPSGVSAFRRELFSTTTPARWVKNFVLYWSSLFDTTQNGNSKFIISKN